jgi:hypothetical protein
VRAVEAEVSPNLGMVQLGGCSPEREKTAAALSKIRREGEASGGRRRRYGRGNGREGGGAREGGRSRVGVEGVDEWARSRFERLGRRRGREGKKREGGSGRKSATRRRTASWGLAPTGGWRPDCVPAGRDPVASRAGSASLFRQRRAGADWAGSGGSESGEAEPR